MYVANSLSCTISIATIVAYIAIIIPESRRVFFSFLRHTTDIPMVVIKMMHTHGSPVPAE